MSFKHGFGHFWADLALRSDFPEIRFQLFCVEFRETETLSRSSGLTVAIQEKFPSSDDFSGL